MCRHIMTKLRNYRESGPCPVLWIPNITENTAPWSKNMYIVIVVMFVGDGDCDSGNGGCDPSTGLLDQAHPHSWIECWLDPGQREEER